MSEVALNLYQQPLKDGNSHQRPMGHFLVVSTQTVWASWSCSMIGSQCGYINHELWLYIGNDLVVYCVLVLPARFSKMVCCGLVFNGCFHSSTEVDTIYALARLPHKQRKNPNTIANYKGPNQNQKWKMSSSIFCSGCVNHGTLSGSELNLQFHRHENKGNATSLSIKLSG